jgi:hypothetical protein
LQGGGYMRATSIGFGRHDFSPGGVRL